MEGQLLHAVIASPPFLSVYDIAQSTSNRGHFNPFRFYQRDIN